MSIHGTHLKTFPWTAKLIATWLKYQYGFMKFITIICSMILNGDFKTSNNISLVLLTNKLHHAIISCFLHCLLKIDVRKFLYCGHCLVTCYESKVELWKKFKCFLFCLFVYREKKDILDKKLRSEMQWPRFCSNICRLVTWNPCKIALTTRVWL